MCDVYAVCISVFALEPALITKLGSHKLYDSSSSTILQAHNQREKKNGN